MINLSKDEILELCLRNGVKLDTASTTVKGWNMNFNLMLDDVLHLRNAVDEIKLVIE